MDIKELKAFVDYCNERLPISIGVTCHTDMSDGEVIEINSDKVLLNHFNKGYDQWWDIKNIYSAETNISRFGINNCLKIYLINNTCQTSG